MSVGLDLTAGLIACEEVLHKVSGKRFCACGLKEGIIAHKWLIGRDSYREIYL